MPAEGVIDVSCDCITVGIEAARDVVVAPWRSGDIKFTHFLGAKGRFTPVNKG